MENLSFNKRQFRQIYNLKINMQKAYKEDKNNEQNV